MKVLIVSDSHGRCYYLERVILKTYPVNYMIHLGDVEGDEAYIREICSCPVYMIAGNNDYFSRENREETIELGKYRIFLTHGHRYGIYSGAERIKQAAREHNANIVMYGHTHIPKIDLSDDVWTINPGSISLPRQSGREPSYIIMEIDSYGEAHFTVNYIHQ